jgi:EAL domain-containing protein (putative c-di-GMP-specific phosphodiesterase class I)
LREWQARSPRGGPLSVSVNISARQLQDPGLVATIGATLRESGVDPAALTLEITESVLVTDAEATTNLLHRIKALGVRIAIDDFGTGYSSLSYLKRLPIDMLKIDRSFVSGLGRSAEDTAIVAATIAFAHGLGLVATAEGIETDHQLGRLRELGCDRGQGYLFARPLPAESLEGLLVEMPGTGSADPVTSDEPEDAAA